MSARQREETPASTGPSCTVAGSRLTSSDRSTASDALAATPPYGEMRPNERLTDTSTLAFAAQSSDGPSSDVTLGLIETDTGHVAPWVSSATLVSTPSIP